MRATVLDVGDGAGCRRYAEAAPGRMTGIEFHQTLWRRLPDQARAPIFLGGVACNREAAACLDSFANQHVEKPFDAVGLRARVEAHLAAHSGSHPPEAA